MSVTIRVTSAEEHPLEPPNTEQATEEALAAFRADVRRYIEQ